MNGLGTEGSPYLITTLDELNQMRNSTTSYYRLQNDVDASATSTWNSGAGWIPIGSRSSPFTGSLDGAGYKITNLYINASSTVAVGLFGSIQGSTIQKLGLVDVDITGNGGTASLAGTIEYGATVTKCFCTGTISSSTWAGGLIGAVNAVSSPGGYSINISDNYSLCNVTATTRYCGGFISSVDNDTSVTTVSITRNYCSGTVTCPQTIGGFMSYLYYSGTPKSTTYCYYDSTVSGLSDTTGSSIPKTTAQMKTQGSFSTYDFDITWGIDSTKNDSYPYLIVFQPVAIPLDISFSSSPLSSGDVTTQSVQLSYTGYRIERKTSTGDWQIIAYVSSGTNTLKDTSLVGEEIYTYRVKKYQAVQVSPYSNEVQIKFYAVPNMTVQKYVGYIRIRW